jgi:beta-glucanase (GH16 family)
MILMSSIFLFTNIFQPETIDLSKYTMVWNDEFNDKALNKDKWDFRYLGKRKNGFNITDNLSFENNQYLKLAITKKNNKIYTTMIDTEKAFETKYGYFEAKIQLQEKEGSQSSFWLQSKNYGRVIGNLKESGAEIDIYEYIKKTPQTIYHTIYYDGYGKDKKRITYNKKHNNIKDKEWYLFGLLWDAESYKFFINRELICEIKQGISNHKQYLVLSIEATNWSGEVKENFVEDSFLIDYIRVYKERK